MYTPSGNATLPHPWAGRIPAGRWGRVVLGAAAVLFAAAAVTVHVWRAGTSVTVVSGGPGSPARTTTVHAAGSDSLQLGLLGFAAVFALAAVFYERLTSISLPGGIGIRLSPEQQLQASAAVARRASARAQQPAARARASGVTEESLRQQPRLFHLSMMAAGPPAPTDQVLRATADAAVGVAQAAQHTASYAETMLRLAQTSPEGLRVMAESMGIPPQEWSQLVTGVIPGDVWDKLADRALDQAGAAAPPGGAAPGIMARIRRGRRRS